MGYENLLQVIKQRRTIRQYKKEPVPIEEVIKVLEAARWAPSGRNTQPWEFVVVRSKDKLRIVAEILIQNIERLGEVSRFSPLRVKYLRDMTTFIIVCTDSRFKAAYPQSNATKELTRMYQENAERIFIESVSAAISNILLAATSLGLGTVWWTGTGESITSNRLREVIKIPQELQTICCIPLGYPTDETPPQHTPRPLETMVHFDEFDVSKWRTDLDVERFVQDKNVRAEFFKTGRVV